MTALKIITAPSGAQFSVAADHADRFQALVNDLEAAGYPIKPQQSGGYNPRNIDGTNTPSPHAFGRAIDVNWTENARGQRGAIPEALARDLASKHGLTWGGDWKNRDDMHFEVPETGPRPISARGLTSFAGLPASKPAAPASLPFGLAPVAEQAAPVAPQVEAQPGVPLPFGLSLAAGDNPPADLSALQSASASAQPRLRPIDFTKLAALAAERRKLGV